MGAWLFVAPFHNRLTVSAKAHERQGNAPEEKRRITPTQAQSR
jgi:hypothetical protein